MSDHYKTLGIERTASPEEIKSAYRKLAMQYHPDRNPGNAEAEAKFKQINEAHDVLKDAGRKATYDAESRYGGTRTNTRWSSYSDWGFTPGSMEDKFSDEILRDILRRKFRDSTYSDDVYSKPKNRDINLTYNISLSEAYTGKEAELSFHTVSGNKKVEVTIPKGVEDGAKLRFVGKGETIISQATPGDLYVTIRVMQDPRFVRHGVNLATSVEVDYIDAMLGVELIVPCVDGSKVSIKCPPNIRPGQSLKVRGKGMPYAGTQGDLMVEVVLKPPLLTPEQRERLARVK